MIFGDQWTLQITLSSLKWTLIWSARRESETGPVAADLGGVARGG